MSAPTQPRHQTAEPIVRRLNLKQRRSTPVWWDGHCPSPDHSDANASFSYNVVTRRGLCRACDWKPDSAELEAMLDMSDALASGGKSTARGVSLSEASRRAAKATERAFEYIRDGQVQFRKVRLGDGPGKRIWHETPTGRGGWRKGKGDAPPVLYNHDAVRAAAGSPAVVLFCEGEPKAEQASADGFVGTTVGGVNDWRTDHVAQLAGCHVVLLPDWDPPGHAHMAKVAEATLAHAASLAWLDLPGLGAKEDLVDWRTRHTAKELRAAVAAARVIRSARDIPPSPHEQSHLLRAIDVVTELPTHPFPERETLLTPFVETGSLSLIYGPPGVGKTRFATGIAVALAQGGTVGRYHAHRSTRVLYVDGELQGHRVRAIFAQARTTVAGGPPEPGFLSLITPDAQPDAFLPNLATPATQRALLARIDAAGAEVVFLDNLSCLWSVEDDNASSQWDDLQSFLLTLRRRGIATVLLHHAGKSGKQLGTSKKEFIVDTTIKLSRPDDYDASQGTRFAVEYEKARGFIAGAERFEAALVTEEGVDRWKHYVPTDPRLDALQTAIDALHARKIEPSLNALAKETGLNRSTVHRLLQRLERRLPS
jgi:KaiC/GvpD/RAD55 family RecA-like ATPase